MIKCLKCKIHLDESNFYKCRVKKDGLTGECKCCTKLRVSANRLSNIDYYRDKEREYQQTAAGKLVHKKAVTKWRKNNPYAYGSHLTIKNALDSGDLIKPLCCEVCNDQKVLHAHHDDYNFALDVRWLCIPCHKEWHNHNTPIKRC